jgi:hypothetical protein
MQVASLSGKQSSAFLAHSSERDFVVSLFFVSRSCLENVRNHHKRLSCVTSYLFVSRWRSSAFLGEARQSLAAAPSLGQLFVFICRLPATMPFAERLAKRVTHLIAQRCEEKFVDVFDPDLRAVNLGSEVSTSTRSDSNVRTHVLVRRFLSQSTGLLNTSSGALSGGNDTETHREKGEGPGTYGKGHSLAALSRMLRSLVCIIFWSEL